MTVSLITSCSEDFTEPYLYENFYWPSRDEIRKLCTNSEGNFFAATEGGLYVSTDKAKNWNLLTNFGDKKLDVTDIIITSDDYIFIACDTIYTSYLFVSSDKGISWNKLPPEMYIQSIEMDSHENIYLCGSGLKKSTDNGNSWIELYTGSIYDACFPNDSCIVIGTYPGGVDGQIVYSTNNGSSWNSTGYIVNVSAFYKYGSTIFVGGFYGEDTGGGVHKSTDSGITWVSCHLEHLDVSSFTTNKYNVLFISVLWGGGFIYYTKDSGETWVNVYHSNPCLTLMKDERSFLYGGIRGGGLLRSTDNGMSWRYGMVK